MNRLYVQYIFKPYTPIKQLIHYKKCLVKHKKLSYQQNFTFHEFLVNYRMTARLKFFFGQYVFRVCLNNIF